MRENKERRRESGRIKDEENVEVEKRKNKKYNRRSDIKREDNMKESEENSEGMEKEDNSRKKWFRRKVKREWIKVKRKGKNEDKVSRWRWKENRKWSI